MSVYKHQQGKWMYDFWVKKMRHSKGGYETKQEARDAEARARKSLKKMNVSFLRLCGSRLRDLKRRRTRKYYKENKMFLKKIVKLWGKKKEIKRKDVEDYLFTKSSNLVANKELRFIKALFNHGIERELINYNPAERVKYFPIKKKKKYIPPETDVKKVLATAEPKHRLYLQALISTLARVGELNKLKWEDIHDGYLILRTRKSKNSDLTERVIPINQTLEAVLKTMPKVGDYVFCYKKSGKPYQYRSKLLKNACEKAGIKEFGYHALRHYAASKLADSSVPITVIQALLGHQRTTTTDIYLQSIGRSLFEAVKNLESQ